MTAPARALPAPLSLSHREGGSVFGDALIILVPLLLAVDFNAGGRLFLSEIVLLIALPFLLDQARRQDIRCVPHVPVLLGLVWLFGQVITDLVRVTPEADFSRGWSKIAFLLANLAALSLLVNGNWRRIWLFGAGLALGELLQFYVNPSTYAASDAWKFGFGTPITLAAVLVAARPSVYRRPLVAPAILIALAVVNLQMEFRSLAGVCFLAGVVTLLSGRAGRHPRVRDRRRVVAAAFASVLAAWGFVQFYGYAASSGMLGARAAAKYHEQQSPLGIVIGGRTEVLVAIKAVRDSPIIGHGSWAKDPKYVQELTAMLRAGGYQGAIVPFSSNLIPTHSHILGAWVEAGVLGAVFWFWALGLTTAVLARLHRLGDHRVPLVAFIGFSFAWDVLFSPFGAERRVIVPFYLLALLLTRDALRRADREVRV